MTAARSGRGLRAFIPIWLAQTVSALGTGLIGFALAVRVFQETGSVTRYAFLGLSVSLPGLLLVPVAGYVADRFDRRLVIILANLASAANNVLLYYLVTHGYLQVWTIYPVVMLSAVFGTFASSSLQVAVTLLVGKEHFGRVSGMIQIRNSVVQVMAPILAAMLLRLIDLKGIVLINLVSYLAPPVVLAFLRLPRPEVSEAGRAAAGGGVAGQVVFGWRFIRQRPGLFRLLLLAAVGNFAFAMVSALLTPLILGFSTVVLLGLVSSIGAAGTLTGGIVMSVWGGPRNRVRASLLALLAAGLLLQLGGLRPSITLIAAAAFFYLACFPIVTGVGASIWRSKVPADVQGRIFAVRRLVAGWSVPVSLLIAGPLADRVFEPAMMPGGALAGSVGTVIGVGPGRGIGLMLVLLGLVVIVNVAAGFASPSLRRLEEEVPDILPDDETPGAARRESGRRQALGRLGPVPAAAVGLVLAAAVALSLAALRPPPAVGRDAPATEFSAERAAHHLAVLAREPHPVGTAALGRVRDYLLAQLDGFETEVQRATPVVRQGNLFTLVSVENVLARLPGTAGRRGSVLLVAHYDSVPNGPGAGDDGAAVAALLETARALAASERLPADVVFLFTDAEEAFLNGARAFVGGHPWADDVAVVLNFDARGDRGPVLMFQTGPSNAAWIPRFAAAATRPVASSLLDRIYRRLPNDTDFTAFETAGYPGFNFAMIEGLTHYHNALDRPEEVSLASLQHQGSYALGLTRELASLDLRPARDRQGRDDGDRVYFSLASRWLVHYPRAAGYALAAVALLVFAALLARAVTRGRVNPFGLWQGFLAFLGQLVAVPAAVTLIWMVVRDVGSVPVIEKSTPAAAAFMAGFAFLAVAVVAAVYRLMRRLTGALELFAGALLWWLVGIVLTSGLALPADANVLFVWPFCGALVAFTYLCLTPPEAQRPWTAASVLAAAALPGILLVVPFTAILYVGLQGLTELGGLALLPAVLLAGLLFPLFELASRGRAWLPAAAAVLGVAWLGVALASPKPAVERESSLFYAYDADVGEASWFSFDDAPTEWTRQLGLSEGSRASLAKFYPLLPRPLLHHDAPQVPLPGTPELTVAAADGDGELRRYEVRLSAGGNPRGRLIWFEPLGAVVSARLAGADVELAEAPGRRGPVVMELPVAAGDETLSLSARGAEPVTVVVLEQYNGLPPIPGLPPRPPEEIVRSGLAMVRSDVTLVRRSFVLEAGVE